MDAIRRPRRPFGLLLLVALLLTTAAGTEHTDPATGGDSAGELLQVEQEIWRKAAVVAIAETWMIGKLDGFSTPMPDTVDGLVDVRLDLGTGPSELRPVLMTDLASMDIAGLTQLNELASISTDEIPPNLVSVLTQLPEDDYERLDNGEPISIDPLVYALALEEVLDALGLELADVLDLMGTDDGAADSGSGLAGYVLGAIAISLGLLFAGVIGVLRHRQRVEVASRRRAAAIEEVIGRASRSMAGTLDPRSIERIAVGAAARLSHGFAARLVAVDDIDNDSDAELRDVASSAVSAISRHGVAVPVVGDGSVVAVLLVDGASAVDEPALAELASHVGASLTSAQAHEITADVDALTAVFNRRRLDRDLTAAVESDRPTALVMVDIDHFKSWNDEHGHATGDRVLQLVAETIRRSVRPGDVVYRYGGEEFAVVLADTDTEAAAPVAERIRSAVESQKILIDGADLGPITASLGVADESGELSDPAQLSERADMALYAAKNSGRNRVVLSPPS